MQEEQSVVAAKPDAEELNKRKFRTGTARARRGKKARRKTPPWARRDRAGGKVNKPWRL